MAFQKMKYVVQNNYVIRCDNRNVQQNFYLVNFQFFFLVPH